MTLIHSYNLSAQSIDDAVAADGSPKWANKKNALEALERSLKSDDLRIITDRWTKDDEEFQNACRESSMLELERLRSQLRSLIVGRTMLQDLLHRQGKIGMLSTQ